MDILILQWMCSYVSKGDTLHSLLFAEVYTYEFRN